MYELKIENFTGPLEKLLELIEERKMDITELSLAEVTDDFLKYLNEIKKLGKPDDKVRILSDFVVVAARLILIKSKALLPSLELTQEEREDIKDLEERLRRYREFKPAIANIKRLWQEKNAAFSRQFLAGKQSFFQPAENVKINFIRQAIEKIFQSIKELELEVQTIEGALVKLEEKIGEILGKIKNKIGKFSDMIAEKSRSEIIVMFLALLHLLRDQIVNVEQKGKFSDIIIKKVGKQ